MNSIILSFIRHTHLLHNFPFLRLSFPVYSLIIFTVSPLHKDLLSFLDSVIFGMFIPVCVPLYDTHIFCIFFLLWHCLSLSSTLINFAMSHLHQDLLSSLDTLIFGIVFLLLYCLSLSFSLLFFFAISCFHKDLILSIFLLSFVVWFRDFSLCLHKLLYRTLHFFVSLSEHISCSFFLFPDSVFLSTCLFFFLNFV